MIVFFKKKLIFLLLSLNDAKKKNFCFCFFFPQEKFLTKDTVLEDGKRMLRKLLVHILTNSHAIIGASSHFILARLETENSNRKFFQFFPSTEKAFSH